MATELPRPLGCPEEASLPLSSGSLVAGERGWSSLLWPACVWWPEDIPAGDAGRGWTGVEEISLFPLPGRGMNDFRPCGNFSAATAWEVSDRDLHSLWGGGSLVSPSSNES